MCAKIGKPTTTSRSRLEEVLTLQTEPRLELRSAVIGVSELTHLRELRPDWSLAWRGRRVSG